MPISSLTAPFPAEHWRLSATSAKNGKVAMCADDVSLFSSHVNKEVAKTGITTVMDGGRARKLTNNDSICEVACFTDNSNEAHWQLTLQLDGSYLNTISLQKFLGVAVDMALFLEPHSTAIVSRASDTEPQRCQLRCPGLAAQAGPNPTGPAGMLSKSSIV